MDNLYEYGFRKHLSFEVCHLHVIEAIAIGTPDCTLANVFDTRILVFPHCPRQLPAFSLKFKGNTI
jgi:hypothetical protein